MNIQAGGVAQCGAGGADNSMIDNSRVGSRSTGSNIWASQSNETIQKGRHQLAAHSFCSLVKRCQCVPHCDSRAGCSQSHHSARRATPPEAAEQAQPTAAATSQPRGPPSACVSTHGCRVGQPTSSAGTTSMRDIGAKRPARLHYRRCSSMAGLQQGAQRIRSGTNTRRNAPSGCCCAAAAVGPPADVAATLE